MYLIEDRKLLDAYVFKGQQEVVKRTVTNFDFRLILCWLRFLIIFTLLSIRVIKKHTLFNKLLSQKIQSIWQQEGDGGCERRMFVCYILDIYYSLHSIIHSIAWTHSIAHTSNDKAKFSIKLKFLHPAHLLFSKNELR